MTTSLAAWRGCTALERRARERLAPRWHLVPADAARVCKRTATFSGAGRYALLDGCIRRLETMNDARAAPTQ